MADDIVAKTISDTTNISFLTEEQSEELFDNRAQPQKPDQAAWLGCQ
jgi:hypothetical protein